jgi:hypothetical protein
MVRRPWLVLVVELVLLLMLLSSFECAAGKKKKKSFNDIDLKALEKEWENGDADEELITDHQLKLKKMEAMRQKAPKFDPECVLQ